MKGIHNLDNRKASKDSDIPLKIINQNSESSVPFFMTALNTQLKCQSSLMLWN